MAHSRIMRTRRRETLVAGGAALGSWIVGPRAPSAAGCMLTSRQIDDPYNVAGVDNRKDLREDKPGVDMELRFKRR